MNPRPRADRRIERAVVVAIIAAIGCFNLWCVTDNAVAPQPLFGERQDDYYNQLARAFLHGHLYLETVPDPRLAACANPYDSAQRPPGVGLHDASYFRGRYYLYFGAAPALTLLAPWRLITGRDLPENYAVFVFAMAGFVASVGLWRSWRRRYFPNSGWVVLIVGIAALGLASGTHAILRRTDVWEEAVASGYCYAMLALYFLDRGLRGRPIWLAASGICLGLAVGSRPNTISGAAALLIFLAWNRWRGRTAGKDPLRDGRTWCKQALAMGAAFGAVLAAMLWYNFARFGNAFEFGQNYQLTFSTYEARLRHFSASFVGFNAYLYGLAPSQWSRYFPFVEAIHSPPSPPGHMGIEYPYGILTHFPFLGLALLAPLAWRRRPADERDSLTASIGAVAVFGFATAGMLLFFMSAAARYMVDFEPALALLAGAGLLGLERSAPAGWVRGAALSAAAAAAAFSAFVGAMLNFQLYGLWRESNPASYARVAHAFDVPVSWFERLIRTKYGPLEIKLRLPEGAPGQIEPLVTTGWEGESDYLFIRYLEGRRLQFGFDHTGSAVVWGPALAADPDSEHELNVTMGSVFPPREHPFFYGRDRAAVDGLTRWLRVEWDGRTALDSAQYFFDASPGAVRLGKSPVDTFGRKFTGHILAVRRDPVAAPGEANGGLGAVKFTLSLRPGPTALGDPLISTGRAGRGDVMYVRFVAPDQATFGYDHGGTDRLESGPIPLACGPLHTLYARLPSLLPAGGGPEADGIRDTLLLVLDGRTVWAQRVPFFAARGDEVCLARNGAAAASCDPEFSGSIAQIERFSALADVPTAARGPLRLVLRLPTGRTGRAEPLVTTGVPGRADLLSVRYADPDHLRFALDHWGRSYKESAPVKVDYSRIHELAIRLPTLDWPGPADGGEFTGELEILVDGASAWRTQAAFYRAAPGTLTIAANRIGGSTCDESFSGGVVAAERPQSR